MKLKIFVRVLVLAAAVGGAAYWFFHPKAPEVLTLYGNIDQRQVHLAFIDSERLDKVLVQEGDKVKAGQILAVQEKRRLEDQIHVQEQKIDSAQAALVRLKNGSRPEEIKQAHAVMESAQADAAFAEKDYKRIKTLWDRSAGQAVSRQLYEEAESRLRSAKAKVKSAQSSYELAVLGPRQEDIDQQKAQFEAAKAELRLLRNKLEDAQLKSPSDSTVTRRLLEPGDMASAQKAVLSLTVDQPIWVRAYVNEKEMARVPLGTTAEVYNDAYPDKPLESKVAFISSAPEFTPKSVETQDLRSSLVYEIRLTIQGEHPELKLGMPVTVKFPNIYR